MPANPENMKVSAPSKTFQLGGQEWSDYLSRNVFVDLDRLETPCELVYQVLPPVGIGAPFAGEPDLDASLYEFGQIKMDAQTVIYFAQASLIQWIQSIYGVGQEGDLVANGVYDCATARAMAVYARQLRAAVAGLPPNQAPDLGDGFQMTALELQHLLSTSGALWPYVAAEVRKANPDVEAFLFPIPDDNYRPPPVPAACGFTTVGGAGTGEWGVGPVEVETVSATREQEQKTSNLLIWGGLGLGVVGAALFASTFMKK